MMRAGSLFCGLLGFWRDRRGASLVEFAITLPITLMIIMGGIEFGRVYWVRHTLQFAAEETGRYAMAHTTVTADQLKTYAQANLPGLDPASATVTVTPDNVGGVNYVTIKVTTLFDFLIPLVDLSSLTLTGTTRVPLLS
jgi:Flp pilus assembly protein TadG